MLRNNQRKIKRKLNKNKDMIKLNNKNSMLK